MTPPQYRVDHPRNGMKLTTTRFSAFGDAPANSLIYGTAIGEKGHVCAGNTVRQPAADGRWTINFLDVPFEDKESFRLEFRKDHDGGPVVAEIRNLRINLGFGATINWPLNGSDNCNTRVSMYGSLSAPDTMITELKLGGVAASWTYFDPGSGYIAAEFSVGNGVHTLVLKGDHTQTSVNGINCHSNFC
jgi:hypothetical protein